MADPVWLLVMFDLPVASKFQRRAATAYRKLLLNQGFDMVQLSVYSKYLINATGVRPVLTRLKTGIPPNGAVRMIQLSDDQWAAQHRFFGLEVQQAELKLDVLEIFETWEQPFAP